MVVPAITKELLIAYILEGIAIGFLVGSIGVFGSVVNDNIEEENTKTRRIFLFIFTMLAAFTSHILAESLRHDRIVGLLKNVSSRFNFRKNSNGSTSTSPPTPRGLFRKRSNTPPVISKPPIRTIRTPVDKF